MSIFGDVDELTGGFADALGERLDSRPSRRGPTPLEAYLAKFRATAPSWQALGPAQAAGAWSPGVPSWQSFGQRQEVGLWQPQAQGWQQAGDFFGQYRQAKGAREQAEQAAAGKSGTAVEVGDWSGPATADDNATLDGAKIDQWIAATRPNSPLRGMGQHILDRANALGVSVPLFMGILLKESELGTTAGPGFNLAGVGGEGNFRQYGSWQEALDDALGNLAGPTYKGKSAADQVGMWFVGRTGDLNATDSTGGRNGTVGTYLNGPVAQAYGGLGVPFNQGAAGTRRAPSGDGTSPVPSYTADYQLHWGEDDGIGGTDIFAPAGSPVVSIGGGKVVSAGWSDIGGWNVTVQLDNGLLVYMAHLQQRPSVAAGQRVDAGSGIGYVGNTGNASTTAPHLHIGIGETIVSGGGARGGTGAYRDGRPFDALSYLRSLRQRRAAAAAAPVQRGRPS